MPQSAERSDGKVINEYKHSFEEGRLVPAGEIDWNEGFMKSTANTGSYQDDKYNLKPPSMSNVYLWRHIKVFPPLAVPPEDKGNQTSQLEAGL